MTKRFIDSKDETEVKDMKTGIVWYKDDEINPIGWHAAKVHCDKLGNGYRLPTTKELQSLTDFELSINYSVNIKRNIDWTTISTILTSDITPDMLISMSEDKTEINPLTETVVDRYGHLWAWTSDLSNDCLECSIVNVETGEATMTPIDKTDFWFFVWPVRC